MSGRHSAPGRALAILCLAPYLIASCASSGSSIALDSNFTREPKPVRVQLVLSQQQLTATAMSTDSSAAHAAAAGTGQIGGAVGVGAVVVGHLLAEAIIRGVDQGKNGVPDPLLDFTKKYTIGEQYGRQFRAALEGSRWIRLTGMDVAKEGDHITPLEDLRKAYPGDALMLVRTRYFFSTTYRQMYVETTVDLWPADGGTQPAYRATYHFSSPQIGASDLEETLQLWSANNASRFRSMLSWGLTENLNMLRMAVTETNRAVTPPVGTGERVTYSDRLGNAVEFDAQLLQQTPQERVFRADADYYALARRDMPLVELDNHLAAVDRMDVNVVSTGW